MELHSRQDAYAFMRQPAYQAARQAKELAPDTDIETKSTGVAQPKLTAYMQKKSVAGIGSMSLVVCLSWTCKE